MTSMRWSRFRWARIVPLVAMLLIVTPSCQGSAAQAPSAGLTGHVGPVARSCEGVAVGATDDLQAIIDSHPAGTTYCLSSGVHRRESPVAPKRGDLLIGQLGAVLSGSKVLTGWRSDGASWSATGFLPPAPGTHGECLTTAPMCAHVEDVFVDGQRLRPVGSASAVTAGTVFADYTTNTITIGDDPASHLIEQAVAPSLIRATVDDVTVANLVLEQAANEAQTAAVESREDVAGTSGSGWRILDNDVRLNHGVGIGVADAATVTGNLITNQGQLGVGAWGTGGMISDNEISMNGAAGYDAEWEAGGAKSWMTQNLTLTHNDVHDNFGPGLWTDGGNIDTTYSYNKITDNWNGGIQHEISYDATITHNEISGNGRRHKGWAWDAGIQIQSSGGIKRIEIAYNVVDGNANGISLIDSGNRAMEDPAPHGPHVVRNVWVHDNSVAMFAGQSTGAVEDTGNLAIFNANDNLFDANTYYLQSLTEPHFVWAGDDVGWNKWQGLGGGNDLKGRAELVDR